MTKLKFSHISQYMDNYEFAAVNKEQKRKDAQSFLIFDFIDVNLLTSISSAIFLIFYKKIF